MKKLILNLIVLSILSAIALPENTARAGAICASWDIKDLCCPSYCAAKTGNKWSSADTIFDACIVSIGCKTKHTSGFMACGTCK